MKRRLVGLALLGLIFFFAGGIVYTLGTPRLLEAFPAPGAQEVPSGSALRLTFSRSMQPASIQDRIITDPPLSGQYSWQGNVLTFTPEEPWPSGRTIQIRLEPGALASGLLSLPMTQSQSWTFTTGYPRVVYLYPASGPADLYLIDPLTGENQRLTRGLGEVLDFSVDRTGRAIYFSASRGGGSAIYRWDRAVGEANMLLECPQAVCRALRISPGGDLLAYERTDLEDSQPGSDGLGKPEVWLLPLSISGDSGPAPAGPRLAGEPGHRTLQPSWSPTGLLTFYDTTLSAFIVQDPEGEEIHRFPSKTGLPGSWEPRGETYVFAEVLAGMINDPDTPSDVQPLPASHILSFSQGDSLPKDLSQADNLEDSSPVFSPKGEYLVFARKYLDLARWTPGKQIWLMRADGSEAYPITDEPFYNHSDFAWSPDGDQIVYVRFNQDLLTDPPEVWLINADGTRSRPLVTGGYYPQWLP